MKGPKNITFAIRQTNTTPVIDWAAVGGYGCRPATNSEVELWSIVEALDHECIVRLNTPLSFFPDAITAVRALIDFEVSLERYPASKGVKP